MHNRRVAVTGIGAVTPVGNDAESTWAALVAGRSGVGRLDSFVSDTYPVRIGGMVKGFDLARQVPSASARRHLSRAAGFGVAAMLEAVADARITADTYPPHERGLSIGATMGRPELQEVAEVFVEHDRPEGQRLVRQAPSAVLLRDQNIGPAVMAALADCQGPMISVSTACAGSAHAIGEAFRSIQEGDANMMIAGGQDALTSWVDVLGFSLLGALATGSEEHPDRACRPFDRERSGFVLGEGAVVMVLEEWDAAKARGAPIRAELLGYGSSLNAYRITDAPPDGGGAILAITGAMTESGVRLEEFDYVAAHGTGTPGNDLSETLAIKKVFGEHAYRLAISSPKSMTGHLTGAAAALNLLVAIFAMRDQVVPPTINYEVPDPKLDLDYVPNTARHMPVRAALVDAFAFGGTNAALVVCGPNYRADSQA